MEYYHILKVLIDLLLKVVLEKFQKKFADKFANKNGYLLKIFFYQLSLNNILIISLNVSTSGPTHSIIFE